MFSSLKKHSFAKKAESRKSDHVFLVRALDKSGKQAWYYVLADRGKRDAFKSKNGTAALILTDYGKILHSGFGEHPPEALVKHIESEYGFTS